MGTIEEMMGNYNNEGWGMGGTDGAVQANFSNPMQIRTPDTGGFDIRKMLSGGLSRFGSMFSAGKGETSVMGGLAPYMQMGMSYLADKKNDPTRANNEAIQRQQIASNTYNADKLRRNDAALGRAFGTA